MSFAPQLQSHFQLQSARAPGTRRKPNRASSVRPARKEFLSAFGEDVPLFKTSKVWRPLHTTAPPQERPRTQPTSLAGPRMHGFSDAPPGTGHSEPRPRTTGGCLDTCTLRTSSEGSWARDHGRVQLAPAVSRQHVQLSSSPPARSTSPVTMAARRLARLQMSPAQTIDIAPALMANTTHAREPGTPEEAELPRMAPLVKPHARVAPTQAHSRPRQLERSDVSPRKHMAVVQSTSAVNAVLQPPVPDPSPNTALRASKELLRASTLQAHLQPSKNMAESEKKTTESPRVGVVLRPRVMAFKIIHNTDIKAYRTLHIQNNTDKDVAFKISTNVPQNHTVKPCKGYVGSRGEASVQVILTGNFAASPCQHLLKVKVCELTEGQLLDLTPLEFWSQTKGKASETAHAEQLVPCRWGDAQHPDQTITIPLPPPSQRSSARDASTAKPIAKAQYRQKRRQSVVTTSSATHRRTVSTIRKSHTSHAVARSRDRTPSPAAPAARPRPHSSAPTPQSAVHVRPPGTQAGLLTAPEPEVVPAEVEHLARVAALSLSPPQGSGPRARSRRHTVHCPSPTSKSKAVAKKRPRHRRGHSDAQHKNAPNLKSTPEAKSPKAEHSAPPAVHVHRPDPPAQGFYVTRLTRPHDLLVYPRTTKTNFLGQPVRSAGIAKLRTFVCEQRAGEWVLLWGSTGQRAAKLQHKLPLAPSLRLTHGMPVESGFYMNHEKHPSREPTGRYQCLTVHDPALEEPLDIKAPGIRSLRTLLLGLLHASGTENVSPPGLTPGVLLWRCFMMKWKEHMLATTAAKVTDRERSRSHARRRSRRRSQNRKRGGFDNFPTVTSPSSIDYS